MKFCSKCGSSLVTDTKFCTNCGNPIKNAGIDNKKIKINNRHGNIFLSRIIPKIIIVVVLITVILTGVFFNRIRGQYYIIEANNAASVTEKLEYSIEAIKVLYVDYTEALLKASLVEIAKNDIGLAEQKLYQVSSILSQGDFKDIEIAIKEEKIDKFYNEGKYQEAVNEFNEIDKLGGDFKSNKNYEGVMLNIVSKITNTDLSDTKDKLIEERKICFDNLDDDPFDEIIELKKNSNNSDLKVNLYKLKNGGYKLVDIGTIRAAWNQKIQGVHDYTTDKKGVFINYANASNNSGTSVFGVKNNKLQLKATLFANNYTKPDDVDKDGIYEILSNSTSAVASDKKDDSKWYKIYEDARVPTIVSVSDEKEAEASANAKDYVVKDSDKNYLTEDDMKKLSKEQLALARNEIFARHGYVFNDDLFKKYFTEKSWYVPNSSYDGSDSTLNQYEIANYQLIQAWEKK